MSLIVTPSVASAAGNCTLRIVGHDTRRVIAILLGTTYFASFRRLNGCTITLVLPATEPGQHTLTLVLHETRQGKRGVACDVACTKTVSFTTASGLTLTAVAPLLDQYEDPRAPVNHYRARRLTLKGEGFSTATAVWQDGVALNFHVVDDHTILAHQRLQRGGCRVDPAREIAARDGLSTLPTVEGPTHCDTDHSVYPGEPGYDASSPCPPAALIHASDITVSSPSASSNVFQLLAVQATKRSATRSIGVLATAPVRPSCPNFLHVLRASASVDGTARRRRAS
jgi:hypothetical protein